MEKIKELKLCDPLDPNCTQGPQIDQIQLNKIMDYIESGKKEGAKCVSGGAALKKKGYWVEPTIFVDVKDDMKIAKEEIFGPVMAIMKFQSIKEVVDRANNSDYGLGAGICTRDIGKAFSVMNMLQAGTVFINCYGVSDPAAPFGGYKKSGHGRELGEDGLEPYLEIKTVITDLSHSFNMSKIHIGN